MADIQILNKETLSDNKYLLQKITYLKYNKQGEAHEMKAEVYFRPDAVALLLYNHQQQNFLLTRQFRMPVYLNTSDTGHLTESCAGLIDEGETPAQTAIREAEEELGYQLTNVKKIGEMYSSAGGITELIHLFIAPYDVKQKVSEGGGAPGEGEDITLVELTYQEAKRMLQQGEIIDAKTIVLLQHFFLFVHKT